MLIETASLPLHLALTQGGSTNAQFQQVLPVLTEPTGDGYLPPVVPVQTGLTAQNQLLILPMAQAGSGSNFSIRVYGWRLAQGNGFSPAWLPLMLAELACVTADLPGPGPGVGGGADPLSPAPIFPMSYNLCDTLTLVQGDLGFYGRINSVGAAGTGVNLPAYALVDLQGSAKISFDFAWGDGLPPSAMNAFWALK